MNKFLKKILYLGLLICFVLALGGIVAACDDKEPTREPSVSGGNETQTVTYTVTVTCDDPIILSTVKVQLKKEDGTAATEATSLKKGSVSFELDAGAYTVELTGASGYEYAAATLTAEAPTATVALVPEGTLQGGGVNKVTYAVTVTLPDGSPVANLMVQLGSQPAMTNSAGVATFSLPAGTYAVKIDENQTTYPALYTFDNAKYTVSATTLTLTVVFDLAPLMDITVGLVYSDNSPVEGRTVALHRTTNSEGQGRQVSPVATATAVTDSDGVAVIEAPAGIYTIVLPDCPANYSYQKGLIVETSAPNMPDAALNIGPIVLTELGTNVYNGIPIAAGKTYNVTVTADRAFYYFEFSADRAGYYRISSFGTYGDNGTATDVDTYLEYYAGTKGGYINTTPLERADNENDPHFIYDFLVDSDDPSYLANNYWFFGIGSRVTLAGNETLSFSFTVEFVQEYVPPTRVTESPHATQKKSGYDAPENSTFTRLSHSDVNKLFVDLDGVYHYGSADGPIVFVLLSGDTYPRGMAASFEGALAESGGTGFMFSTGIPDDNNVITVYNLFENFLPEYIAASNGKGMHPLVEELKLFLQQYYKTNGIFATLNWPQSAEGGFLFACGYYKSADEPAATANRSADAALTLDELISCAAVKRTLLG